MFGMLRKIEGNMLKYYREVWDNALIYSMFPYTIKKYCCIVQNIFIKSI